MSSIDEKPNSCNGSGENSSQAVESLYNTLRAYDALGLSVGVCQPVFPGNKETGKSPDIMGC